MGLENMGKDIVVLCLLAGSVLSAGCGKGGTVVSSCKAETPVSLDSLERRNIALRDTGGTDTGAYADMPCPCWRTVRRLH